MSESDSAGTQTVRVSQPEPKTMASVTDAYLRGQLEKRRAALQNAISAMPATETAALAELLHEVDSAAQRMDQGTYGICESCLGTVEKDRLIADPLVRFCLDCLTSEEQRALERDLELTSGFQRALLPQPDARSRDWWIHYRYKPAGIVSGDYCDLI